MLPRQANLPLIKKLGDLLFCQFHQSIHLLLWPFEVLNTKRVDSQLCDAQVQAPLQGLHELVKAQHVALESSTVLHLSSKPPVSVHDDCHMFRDVPCFENSATERTDPATTTSTFSHSPAPWSSSPPWYRYYLSDVCVSVFLWFVIVGYLEHKTTPFLQFWLGGGGAKAAYFVRGLVDYYRGE